MNTVRVSVITPSFNHAQFLGDTIESVLDQDAAYIEHIVVDGGSTDGTVELLRDYDARYPGRIRWISEPDRGQAHAFNKGLAMARGEIIGWQNSDDLYLPHSFTPALRYLADHPDVSVVYGDCRLVDAAGKSVGSWPVGPFNYPRLFMSCFVANQAALMRRDALVTVGGLNERLQIAMDLDLWLRLGLHYRFAYVPGALGAYRLLLTAKTSTGALRNRIECVQVLESLNAQASLPLAYRPALERALLHHTHELVIVALSEANTGLASRYLDAAVTQAPQSDSWRPIFRRLLMRRVMTTDWYGLLPHRSTVQIPARMHDLLLARSKVTGSLMNQVAAMMYLFRALPPSPRRAALAYALAAFRRDRQTFRYPASMLAALRALLGDPLVDRLNPLFTAMRKILDYRASGKGLGCLWRVGR